MEKGFSSWDLQFHELKPFCLSNQRVTVDWLYPVSKTLSGRLTLADLLMAYHLYLKEKNNVGNKADMIAEADRFYMSK